jgi:hypothetical protein
MSEFHEAIGRGHKLFRLRAAKLLFLAKRARLDILMEVSFFAHRCRKLCRRTIRS